MTTTLALPGQLLGTLSSHIPGPGTHVYEDKIQASLAGSIVTAPAKSKSAKPTISISQTAERDILPKVGSRVLVRILRVQRLQASCSILTVLPTASPAAITPELTQYAATTNDDLQPQAILRKEDIRAYEKDKIVMNESFRVGDIVKANVISLGDERNYYISTAGDEYGVVIARSELGNPMAPISWKEMRDTVTGKGEARKVAKPM